MLDFILAAGIILLVVNTGSLICGKLVSFYHNHKERLAKWLLLYLPL